MNPFSAAASVMSVSDVRLSFAYSPWVYAIVALSAVFLAVVVYRYTLPPVNRFRRLILCALRCAALLLLLFLIFEPLLAYVKTSKRLPVVAILVDNSASMGFVNAMENRGKQRDDLLQLPAIRDLEQRAQVRYFAFSDSLNALSADSLRKFVPAGTGSDIAGALSRAEKTLAVENLSAVILMSDGAYNSGENPARIAATSSVPIYTIGVGDTTGQADAVIAEIVTNELVYAGSRTPVELRLHARGLAGKSSVVRLFRSNGSEIVRQEVKFGGDASVVTTSLSYEAPDEGEIRLTAVLDSVSGESQLENNRRSVIVRVLKRKAQVFLIGGYPSGDLTILRQLLETDTTLEVKAIVEVGGGKLLYGSVIPTVDELGNASLIALCDFPTSRSSTALAENIAQVVLEKRIPLLFLAGPHLSISRLSDFRTALPLESPRQILSEEFVLTRGAASHPALNATSPLPCEWTDLPPVYGGIGNFSALSGGQVVAKLSREALGITEDEPGIVLWELSGRRSVAVLCWGTSRWRMQLAGNQAHSAFYEQLFTRLYGWLVAPAEEQRVKIHSTKKLYSGNETVRFNAQVYGADLVPRDDAALDVRVSSGTRTENIAMRSRGNGHYEGQFVPWSVGEYRFSGTAVAGQDTLGRDNGLFAVEPFNIEFIDSRARYDVLRQIAQNSRASFTRAAEAETLLANLKFESRQTTSRHEVSLWQKGPVIWVIILLLAAEWLIRKRSGML